MEKIIKVAPVIIKNGKFLIVRGEGQNFWKNVGGVVEEDESEIECLKRETLEELGVELKEPIEKYFDTPVTLTVTNPKRELIIKLYKANISDIPKPSSEIEELHWLTKSEYELKQFNIAPQIHDYIVPKLIEDGLLE